MGEPASSILRGSNAADLRAALLDQLVKHAYFWRPDDPFKLTSGKTSPEYIDCKLALSQPEAMAALGRLVLSHLDPTVTAIGGLTMGADPIAMSTAQASATTEHPVRWFSVRKEPKAHGQRKLVEGDVRPGERVAIVDDVVTTAKSTLQALKTCVGDELKLKVAQIIVLVDREESNGLQNLRDAAAKAAGRAVPVVAIFRKSEIVNEWRRRNALETSAGTRSTSSGRASEPD